jgi:hypothetical protein
MLNNATGMRLLLTLKHFQGLVATTLARCSLARVNRFLRLTRNKLRRMSLL